MVPQWPFLPIPPCIRANFGTRLGSRQGKITQYKTCEIFRSHFGSSLFGLKVADQCECFSSARKASVQGVTDDATAFRSLLESLRECDPQFSSKIDDLEKQTNVALKLSLSLVANGSAVEFTFPASLGVRSPMNFADFGEWCRENGVGWKVGLDLKKGVVVSEGF